MSFMDQSSADSYAGVAEFHDLFMVTPWERLRPAVRQAFGGLDETAMLVEIGAGTGVGTRVLAAETRAQITAIEPSRAMRTALTSWIANDPALARRVTVHAAAAPDAVEHHSGAISGFVCAHVLGHLSPTQRARTFAALSVKMSANALGLITTPPARNPEPHELDDLSQKRAIGRFDYRLDYMPTADGQSILSEYQVLEKGRSIHREQYASDWDHPPVAELIAELNTAGLNFSQLDAECGLARRSHERIRRR